MGLVIPPSLLISSWNLSVISCLKNLSWIFLGLRDGTCRKLLGLLPLPWFSGLAILLELVETTGVWPQGLLDADVAMIPKADGDSTP